MSSPTAPTALAGAGAGACQEAAASDAAAGSCKLSGCQARCRKPLGYAQDADVALDRAKHGWSQSTCEGLSFGAETGDLEGGWSVFLC